MTTLKIKAAVAGGLAALLLVAWAGGVAYTRHSFCEILARLPGDLGGLAGPGKLRISLGVPDHRGFTETVHHVTVDSFGKSLELDMDCSYGLASAACGFRLPEGAGSSRTQTASSDQTGTPDRAPAADPSGTLSSDQADARELDPTARMLEGLKLEYGGFTDRLRGTYQISAGSWQSSGGTLSWSDGKMVFRLDEVSRGVPEFFRVRFKLDHLSHEQGKDGTAVHLEKIRLRSGYDGMKLSLGRLEVKDPSRPLTLELKKAAVFWELSDPPASRRFDFDTGLSFSRLLLERGQDHYDVDGLDLSLKLADLSDPRPRLGGAEIAELFRSHRGTEVLMAALGRESTFKLSFDTELNDQDAELELKGSLACFPQEGGNSPRWLRKCLILEGKGEIDAALFDAPGLAGYRDFFAAEAQDPAAKVFRYEIRKAPDGDITVNPDQKRERAEKLKEQEKGGDAPADGR